MIAAKIFKNLKLKLAFNFIALFLDLGEICQPCCSSLVNIITAKEKFSEDYSKIWRSIHYFCSHLFYRKFKIENYTVQTIRNKMQGVILPRKKQKKKQAKREKKWNKEKWSKEENIQKRGKL